MKRQPAVAVYGGLITQHSGNSLLLRLYGNYLVNPHIPSVVNDQSLLLVAVEDRDRRLFIFECTDS